MIHTSTRFSRGSPIGESEPTDIRWGRPSFPSWVKGFRPAQLEAVEQIVEHFHDGRKVVILEAPTGTGKTLIGEMVRRVLQRKTLYVCTTKTLQSQFVQDFPYSTEIKGRENYPTAYGPHWVTAADCSWPGKDEEEPSCQWCQTKSHCPYEINKKMAISSHIQLSVANIAYYLTETNHIGRFSAWDDDRGMTGQSPFGLVIVDEADTLESEILSHVEFRLSKKRIEDLHIEPPDRKTLKAAVKNDSWSRWARDEGIPKLALATRNARETWERTESVNDLRKFRSLERQLNQLKSIQHDLGDGWVYTGYESDEIVFKPVSVREQGNDLIWKHAPRWLLMSATVVSAAQMAADLGLKPHEWASVAVDSGFDPSRRPIVIDSRGVLMSNSRRAEAWPEMADRIQEILDKYPGQRVLVHTVSYRLANFLADSLSNPVRPVLVYRMAKERQAILDDWQSIEGAVLIAPSLERGIDLPDDAARVVIVAKVPFGNIGDKQVSARMYSPGGRTWYAVQTIRALIQMTGRAMRHPNDWSDVWILDKQFIERIWKPHRDLLPAWWRKAIVWHSDAFAPLEERIDDLE